MSSLEGYTAFKDHINAPLLANMTEFGMSPLFDTSELAKSGVDMVLYPLTATRAMHKAAEMVYKDVLEKGHQKDMVEHMQTRMELYDYLNYHDYEQRLDTLFSEKK